MIRYENIFFFKTNIYYRYKSILEFLALILISCLIVAYHSYVISLVNGNYYVQYSLKKIFSIWFENFHVNKYLYFDVLI